ncbi:thioesterase, FlK family [Bradyrhizobium betae]
MPEVTGTPTMILHMEMAAGSAVQPFLPAGHVNVSTSAIWRRHRSVARSDETRPRCAAPWRTSRTYRSAVRGLLPPLFRRSGRAHQSDRDALV